MISPQALTTQFAEVAPLKPETARSRANEIGFAVQREKENGWIVGGERLAGSAHTESALQDTSPT